MTDNDNAKRPPSTDSESQQETNHPSQTTQTTSMGSSSRRRVLQALGGSAAALAFTGSVSADDDDISYTPNDDQRPEGLQSAGEGTSYVRMEDQVTDGTYCVVDEANVATPEGAFMEIHLGTPLEGLPEPADEDAFINTEDGSPQFAFETTLGYSQFLPQGVHQNITVPLFEDDELLAVDGSIDRLPQPAVLVPLLHIDSNDNQEWDNYRPGDPDPAFGVATGDLDLEEAEELGDEEVGDPNDLVFAPPSIRTTDVAAVIPVEDGGDNFHIFRPRGEEGPDVPDHIKENSGKDHHDD